MRSNKNHMKERYHSFLLRNWETGVPENPDWRISIENTRTREMVGFDSLGELVEYLNSVSENPKPDKTSFDGNGIVPPD